MLPDLTFSDTDRPLTVGHNGRGRVNVTNGGVVSGLASATIGGGVSGEGVVDVHGTGAALTFAGTDRSLTVAFEGQGALNVTDGGAIGGVGFSNIASEAGAEGVITVDGTDSRFEYSGTNSGFIVGSRGHGTLHVTNGGLVSGAVFGTVSSDTGGEGVVNIGGAGSTLALTGACTGCNFLQGAFLAIGTNGVGTVNVTGGGRVTVDAAGTGAIFPGIAVGGLGITPGSAGTGHLVVDGVGSAITISGDNAYIEVGGNNGQGQVDVTNGAAVRIEGSNASAYLAPLANTAGVAELNVAGAGSQFDAGSLLAIGKDFFTTAGGGSLATVNVSAGGTVAADLIYIGPNGVVSGSGGNLVGDVENHGTLMPGNSPGVLDIDGDLTLGADGTLVIEIAGGIPGLEYDVLNVSGLLTFGGTLELVFLNEFLPSPNDPTFRFFNATNTLGNFAEILLPSGFNLNLDSNGGFQINAVPLPPAALLLMPALMVLAARRRRSGRPNANRGQTRMAFT